MLKTWMHTGELAGSSPVRVTVIFTVSPLRVSLDNSVTWEKKYLIHTPPIIPTCAMQLWWSHRNLTQVNKNTAAGVTLWVIMSSTRYVWRGYCLCILLILETQHVSLLCNFLMENQTDAAFKDSIQSEFQGSGSWLFLGGGRMGGGGRTIRSQIILRVW